MGKVLALVRRKPFFFVYTIGGFFILTTALRWRLAFSPDSLIFLLGGALGIYILDFAEEFVQLKPSPLRSILFVGSFIPVAFFVTTSSGSYFATGLVLSLYLTLLFWQCGELRLKGTLSDWYRIVSQVPSGNNQRLAVIIQLVLFILITFLFIRS